MVKFRLFGSDSKPPVISHPQAAGKDPLAVTPPIMIIRALHDTPPNYPREYLTFAKGDFLHVLNQPTAEFFLACNPVKQSQGLVPVALFEIIQKQESHASIAHANANSAPSQSNPLPRFPSTSHDSGYGETVHNNHDKPVQSHQPAPSTASSISSAGMRSSQRSIPGVPSVGHFFGRLLYTFQPERPDELLASEGETVLIVAVSNDQWAVAKPIHRLGGPGLVPFNHIQVVNLKTEEVLENPYQTLLEAGVPTAEEWKNQASNYKENSIQLGSFDMGSAEQKRSSGSISNVPHYNGTRNSSGAPSTATRHSAHSVHGQAPKHHTPSFANQQRTYSPAQAGAAAGQAPPQTAREQSINVRYRMEGRQTEIYLIRLSNRASFSEFYEKISTSRSSHLTSDGSCQTPNFVITYHDPHSQTEVTLSTQSVLSRYLEMAERPILFLRGM